MKNKFIVITVAVLMLFTLAACSQTDVIANTAIESFDSVLNVDADKLSSNENGYLLNSPNDKERFAFGETISISFELTPFSNAGLDISRLPDYIVPDGENLLISMENKGYAKETSADNTFKKLVKNNRDAIGYHPALDHYGVALGNGNMFEWAKDVTTNEKDIVFVLNPQPFIDAGADVENIDGWIFAKVEMMDDSGKKIEVDKLLKPYNIK